MESVTASPLIERLQNAIEKNPYLHGKSLRFEHQSGHVVMTGTVGSYFQSQMAQESVKQLEGVTAVDNQLEVTAYQAMIPATDVAGTGSK